VNVNSLLFRKGKPFLGTVCWADPSLVNVKRVGWYAVSLKPQGVSDKVRRYTPVVPDGEGGWRYG
jgi:hypothetical protein